MSDFSRYLLETCPGVLPANQLDLSHQILVRHLARGLRGGIDCLKYFDSVIKAGVLVSVNVDLRLHAVRMNVLRNANCAFRPLHAATSSSEHLVDLALAQLSVLVLEHIDV